MVTLLTAEISAIVLLKLKSITVIFRWQKTVQGHNTLAELRMDFSTRHIRKVI